jgi:DNA-binding MarR family transcriptional regulator
MTPTSDTPARIIQLWMEISRLLRKSMSKRDAGACQMNHLQMHGMSVVAEHPDITMKELADLLHISSPSATSFVDRLVKLSWLERVADAKNRKLVHLRMLPAGKEALALAVKEHSAVMHGLFSLLSSSDQAQFERVLLNLKEALARNVAAR